MMKNLSAKILNWSLRKFGDLSKRLGSGAIHALLLCGASFVVSCAAVNRVYTKESVTFSRYINEPGIPKYAYGSAQRETRLEIIAKPEFRTDRFSKPRELIRFQNDQLDDDSPIFWPSSAPDHRTLDTSIPWHFELLRRTGGFWKEHSRTEVLRVHVRDQLVFDASICKIHNHPMTRIMEVPDEYSGRLMPKSWGQAFETRFPNPGTGFFCDSYYPNSDLVWRCSDCAAAAKVWCRKYAHDAPYL
jgi:hypothetical protein